MHPERKNAGWMKYIVQKFTRPGNVVIDACAGTFSVAKACLLLPKYRLFIKHEVEPGCVAKEMMQMILLYARQVLIKESAIDGKREGRICAEVYVNAAETIELQKRLGTRKVAEGLPFMYMLLPYIILLYDAWV